MPTLFVVATPIGNLSDMTPRAMETLKNVALIAAEDTRVTRKLLSAFALHTPLTSCHEHNETDKAQTIIARMLEENIDVALTTDAGTPCISDPGSVLVDLAIQNGIEVIAIPGASAIVAALSISGFALEEFTFYGFLPRQKGALAVKLSEMASRSRVAVVYESPHRVIDLISAIQEQFPSTLCSVSCDLTKKFELTLHGTVSQVLATLKENPKAEKGEYCLVLKWQDTLKEEEKEEASLEAMLFDCVIKGMSVRDGMETLIAQGHRKNAVYAASLRLKELLKQ
ncbi:MAG TPA: 16S rRNA (cytidine(1402)-2'-O)-methyltransferase [Candidatus Limiplasma sp.]|nr:16S rRNA (cytidine(1402)-2'-O)-methyltransferase [Candidatus Limiplasma sp.]HRX09721.1 16S rRNA (cytidine(1402)-2'-O)-methyltransferase [Candidatus Limiplasma sp.]